MSNKHIAITWAKKQVSFATGLVYSDQFFKPFTNIVTRKKIAKELLENNVIVWSDSKDGAFLFKKGDPRLIINSNDEFLVGMWHGKDKLISLPTIKLN